MSNNGLRDMYEKSILELFEEAKNCNPDLFMQSLVVSRHLVEISWPDGSRRLFSVPDESPEMDMDQAFKTVEYYEQAVGDERIDKRVRAPLALMLSFHLLEADPWHAILGNLLKVVVGGRPQEDLFREVTLHPKYLGMMRLLKKCSQKKTLSISNVYQTLCNEDIIDLRNAFSHSQYVLSPGGDVILTKWITLKKKRPAGKRGQFVFSEIQDIFQRTWTFLTILAEHRRKLVKQAPMDARQS